VSHERVAHSTLDIKPDNILVQLEQNEAGAEIREVRLADLEDSAHVPPGKALRGAQLGIWMWRSPESHAMGPIEKPSDMFSFGIVVSQFFESISARN
jgi:serine/threonine protein kinase